MNSEQFERFEAMASVEVPREPRELLVLLDGLITDFKGNRPNDRSEQDRIYAICITLLQQASGTFEKYVVKAK